MDSIKNELLKWYELEGRTFPWRNKNRTTYQILIAEILLQKTRAEKLIGVYENFINKYPTPKELSGAKAQEIKKIIKPLGLQNKKSKDLKEMAKRLLSEFDGEVPSSVKNMKKLPRVSDYVANAVQIFRRGEILPLLDVNTRRVFSRVFSLSGDKEVEKKLEKEAPKGRIKDFYYAIIDLGGNICTKKNPSCSMCPLSSDCNYIAG